MDYKILNDEQRINFLYREYVDKQNSLRRIASKHNISIAVLYNDLKRFNIPIRSKAEAQKTAIEHGRSTMPMTGREHTEVSRMKMSLGQHKRWSHLTYDELQDFREKSRERWQNRSPDDKKEFDKRRKEAILTASKEGSKLEKELLKFLLTLNHDVQFHQEHFLMNQRFQLDLFLPKINVAIEVDGPQHYKNIWNDENAFQKRKLADVQKTGLVLSKGLVLIRIKYEKSLSKYIIRNLCRDLEIKLREIEREFPEPGSRLITIGEDYV